MIKRADHMVYTGGYPFVITLDISDSPDAQFKDATFNAPGGAKPVAWKLGHCSDPMFAHDKTFLTLMLLADRKNTTHGELTITIMVDGVSIVICIPVLPSTNPCCSLCAVPNRRGKSLTGSSS